MIESIYMVAAIALSVGVVFGFSNHVQHIALDHMDVRAGTIVNVATSAALLWLVSPFYLVPETLVSAPIAWFALAGLIVPSVSMTFHALSVRILGPALTAGLASTSPVFATLLAVIILGEIVTGRILAGTAIVVGGIGLIALRSRGLAGSWPLWAVLIPLGAALVRGLSHNLVKIGLDDLPSPMTAALVGSTVSLVVLVSANTIAGRAMPRFNAGYYWFGLCGVLNAIGLVGLNMALGLGNVVVVSPLVATTPAFTLLIGWLFFRRETVRMSSLFAIAVIFSGCLLIITR